MGKKGKDDVGNKTAAVIYLRVSTEEQAKNNSLGNQGVQTRQLFQTFGYEVVRSFIEQFSAKRMTVLSRPCVAFASRITGALEPWSCGSSTDGPEIQRIILL